MYRAAVNYEEQYSLWPAHRELPLGWNDAGKTGPKDECLAHMEEVWTDMRPLSPQRKMEEMAATPRRGGANGPRWGGTARRTTYAGLCCFREGDPRNLES